MPSKPVGWVSQSKTNSSWVTVLTWISDIVPSPPSAPSQKESNASSGYTAWITPQYPRSTTRAWLE